MINHKEVRKTPLVKIPDSLLEEREEREAKARKGSKYRTAAVARLEISVIRLSEVWDLCCEVNPALCSYWVIKILKVLPDCRETFK